MSSHGRVVSVNVGTPREVERRGRLVGTSIWKEPVVGRVAVRGVNVEGDVQADPEHHGGRDKAVYAYAREDYAFWEERLGRALPPGTFGENLTTLGIDVSGARVGERWRVGTTLLEVTGPRMPCWKFELKMGIGGWIDTFTDAERFGTYLKIVEEGALAEGDPVEIVATAPGAPGVREVARAKRGAARRS